MFKFVPFILMGLVLSTALVRSSSRRSMGIDLSWLQALKVVSLRGAVALIVGFGLGRLMFWGMNSGVVSESVPDEHPHLLVAVALTCGLASFAAFQWIIGRISGTPVSAFAVFKSVLLESGYFVLLVLTLLIIVVAIGLIGSAFFDRN